MFIFKALWSRFFPVYEQIRTLLSQHAIGDVKVVRAEFGSNQHHVPRAVQKELGGGALLDIGCYCVQFALMVFNGERPESVTAKGFLYETGKLQVKGMEMGGFPLLLTVFLKQLGFYAGICRSG